MNSICNLWDNILVNSYPLEFQCNNQSIKLIGVDETGFMLLSRRYHRFMSQTDHLDKSEVKRYGSDYIEIVDKFANFMIFLS